MISNCKWGNQCQVWSICSACGHDTHYCTLWLCSNWQQN